LIIAENARELATWSKDAVVVASDVDFSLPLRHRRVPDKAAGQRALEGCAQERLLLEVTTQVSRKSQRGEVLVDVSLSSFGVACDRQERPFFQHGVTFYRVIFGRGRPAILVRSEIAF
jgi:hypothetical protein